MWKISVGIGKDLSEPSDTKQGFKQGHSLSCDFFNLFSESRDSGYVKLYE